MSNNNDNENNNDNRDFESELKSIKDEMKELKDMLKKKAKEEDHGADHQDHSDKSFRIEFDADDFHQFEGVDDTLSSYLGSVMEGVASNLRSSMQQMASGFTIDMSHLAKEMQQAKREIAREKRNIEREVRRAEREVRRATKGKRGKHIIRFHKLSEEELDHFYELAPNLTSALSDEKKLKLLKTLENGPMYQKDLSEQTEIKGGTFKHHMDQLLEVQYVNQEAVRGRYMITQLGVEAIKLSEMLFRRYVFVTDEDAKEREALEDEIIDDIQQEKQTGDELSQNGEEEG